MLRRLATLIFALAITGCATPYQPFELFGRGGYQEKQLTNDTYEVIYYGNHATSMETLNSLLLYRSAELTLSNGYDYFEIVKGMASMPLSTLGGFRTARHTIRMYSGQASKEGPSIHVARKVVAELGPHASKQK